MKPLLPNPASMVRRLASLVGCAAFAASSPAQSVDPAAGKAGEKPETVVKLETFNVSGSLIKGASTFTAPTPVVVVDYEALLAAAPYNMADGLKQLPTIAPGGGQTNGAGTGNSSANFLNLRGLGEARTLTLLDGRRYTPSGPTGQVDVNLIPQGLVDRVDVVNGGTSAAYGSDAVGGVVNFVLNKEFTGLKTDVFAGQSQKGDNKEFKTALSYGTGFLNGRGHFIVGAEFSDSKGVAGDARDLRRNLQNQIPNPANTNQVVRAYDVRSPFTPGGNIINGAGGTAANNAQIRGIKFGPGGTQSPYDYGTLSTTIGTTNGFQSGGDGFRVGTGQEIIRPLTRKSLFSRTDLKISDRLKVFAEGSYGQAVQHQQNSPTTHLLTIQRDNAFLAQVAPDLVARMTSLGVTSFTMNRLTLERGLTVSHVNDKNLRGLAGVSGQAGSWTWEVSYQRGTNDLGIPITNNLITARMAVAADAVSVNGQIVPRALAANPGAVAFNPFGAGAPSQAALDYVMGNSQYNNFTAQNVADLRLSGNAFDLPAGPVAVAAGAQWRSLESTTTADAVSVAGGYRLANNQPFYGRYTISEQFVESQVPLLKDLPWAKKITATAAARHTRYSTTGDANAWKFGAVWQLTSEVRLRASRSRDIRAPTLNELFSTGVQSNANISDNFPGGTGLTFQGVPNITIGNRSLRPEIADSLSVGVVYQPAWLQGSSFAIDGYQTEIADAIFNAGGANAVRECDLNPNSPLCAFVFRGPTSASPRAVIRVQTSPVNLNSETSRGLDFETSYRLPLKSWFPGSNPGTLGARVVAGYVDEYLTVSPLAPSINQAGNATGGLPRFRGTLALSHSRDPFSASLQLRFIGRMTWDKTRVLGVTTDFNRVPATAYLDGQVTRRLPDVRKGWRTDLYFNVQNLFDKGLVYSPLATGATPRPTNIALFDQIGRTFRIGLKTRL